jgi:hypothetical protein
MDPDELAYYRAVEDHFAALRGTVFIFSPKDFALLRDWYNSSVPLLAVLAGIDEVSERRRLRDGDPVSSLAYCRHAVVRHAKRLAAAHAGGEQLGAEVDLASALGALENEVRAAGLRWRRNVAVARSLSTVAAALATLPRESDAGAVEEALARLEQGLYDAVLVALDSETRAGVEARVAELMAHASGSSLESDVAARTRRALVIKELRGLLDLPRFGLVGDAG